MPDRAEEPTGRRSNDRRPAAIWALATSDELALVVTAAVALALLAVLALSIAVPETAWERWLPPCAIRERTGAPCPTCGLTRAFAAVGHGDLARAAALHPAGPWLFGATACAAATLGVLFALDVARYRRARRTDRQRLQSRSSTL